jgi:hypothetical protein
MLHRVNVVRQVEMLRCTGKFQQPVQYCCSGIMNSCRQHALLCAVHLTRACQRSARASCTARASSTCTAHVTSLSLLTSPSLPWQLRCVSAVIHVWVMAAGCGTG